MNNTTEIRKGIKIDHHALWLGPSCLVCDVPFCKVGGRRFYSYVARGIVIDSKPRQETGPSIAYCGSLQVQSNPPVFVTVYGDNDHWNAALLDKAAREVCEGRRPWICSRCVDRACKVCGRPYSEPPPWSSLPDVENHPRWPGWRLTMYCDKGLCRGAPPGGGGRWSAL